MVNNYNDICVKLLLDICITILFRKHILVSKLYTKNGWVYYINAKVWICIFRMLFCNFWKMNDGSTRSQTIILSAAKARHRVGVCSKTLRNWDSKGLTNTTRTPTGVRLYDVGSITPSTSGRSRSSRHRIIYCRVSSPKQGVIWNAKLSLCLKKSRTYRRIVEPLF